VDEHIAALSRLVDEQRAAASAPSDRPLLEESATQNEKVERRTTKPASSALAPAATVARNSSASERPIYKKWWLWTIVGVAVAGVAVGLAVGLAPGPSAPSVPTTAGNFHF
jgi:hypothetical protein